MSSVFEVPQQLVLVLAMAASTVGQQVSGPGAAAARRDATLAVNSQSAGATRRDRVDLKFSEEIWLRALKDAGRLPAARALAARIFKTGSGRFYVPIDAERRRIFQARAQRSLALAVAGNFAKLNSARLAAQIARAPTAGELYIAHRLGPEAAARLIKLAVGRPMQSAAAAMPEVAFALTDIFFTGQRARSCGEVYLEMTKSFAGHRLPRALVAGRAGRRTVALDPQAPPQAGAWRVTVAAAQ